MQTTGRLLALSVFLIFALCTVHAVTLWAEAGEGDAETEETVQSSPVIDYDELDTEELEYPGDEEELESPVDDEEDVAMLSTKPFEHVQSNNHHVQSNTVPSNNKHNVQSNNHHVQSKNVQSNNYNVPSNNEHLQQNNILQAQTKSAQQNVLNQESSDLDETELSADLIG